jgi:hypothetical protein
MRCNRPIFFNIMVRKSVRYIACSRECRQTLHNEAYRRRHRRLAIKVSCKACGEAFTPKRADAAYCSAACKQRAYRGRQDIAREEQVPGLGT